jgi:hypothetical protein
MIRINQTLQTPENCRHRTVTATLCPTPGQATKSTLDQTPGTNEIRDYRLKTDFLTEQTKASCTILTHRQPSASLQSP